MNPHPEISSQKSVLTGANRPGRIQRLALKELRETLRDRRTIVTLVLMPIIVYPMLSLAFQKFLLTGAAGTSQLAAFRIGVESEEDGKTVREALQRGLIIQQRRERRAQREREQSRSQKADAETASNDAVGHDEESSLKFFQTESLEQQVGTNALDVGIRIKRKEPFRVGEVEEKGLDCDLLYHEPSVRSREALAEIERLLNALNTHVFRVQLDKLGAKGRATAVRIDRQTVESSGVGAAPTSTLATLVPLILILMTITGAVYPAIDLTAGERERGTLEMLIAAPVPRLQLLLAKYAAVVTVALLTASVNLTSMMVTVWSMGLTRLLFGDAGISLLLVLQVFALLVLFAAFFAAVLLAVTSFARSFKEAQAYLIPLMLVSIAPGMLSMIPGLSLHGPLAVAPLINIVLLARDLFSGEVSPLVTLVVISTTALFALAAIAVAARVFGTDAILYGSEGAWSDLLHRPLHKAGVASFTSALLCLALMFPAYFLAANLVARHSEMSMFAQVLLTAVVTAVLFTGIPLTMAAWNRVRVVDGFLIKPASGLAFLAAAVLGLSLWAFALEIGVVQRALGIATFSEEQFGLLERFVEQITKLPLPLLILRFGIVPAVCEEFFFRGYLLNAFATRVKEREAILLSSMIFGLFHVLTEQLAVERFLPSTMMGLALGWVCVRTGSVLPGMLLHATHNSLLVLLSRYKDEIAKLNWGFEKSVDLENAHLPFTWILIAAVVATAGFLLMRAVTHGRSAEPLNLEPATTAR